MVQDFVRQLVSHGNLGRTLVLLKAESEGFWKVFMDDWEGCRMLGIYSLSFPSLLTKHNALMCFASSRGNLQQSGCLADQFETHYSFGRRASFQRLHH